MLRHALHDAAGQHTELAARAVDEVQLVGRMPHRLEHRRFRSGIGGPDHRVDDRFGVLNQVERPPGRVDVAAGHLHQVRREKLAKAFHQRGQWLARPLGQ